MEARQPDAAGSARRPMAAPSHLHEDLAELSFLLGDWSGTGEGVWPPGERFDYAEDVTFEFVGDPFLLYAQRSWSLDDGSPIHLERGFLRPAGPGNVELLLAHPIGITEVAVGTVDDGVIDLSSTVVSLAPTASPVTELRRRIRGRGEELSFELEMAMEGVELRWHVGSTLARA
jgi:THAP4-like, heme-binding beta-barrel domain